MKAMAEMKSNTKQKTMEKSDNCRKLGLSAT